MATAGSTQRRRFRLYLIKPSHYDDDGYVIQWHRSAIPSNTLAALCGLAMDCRQRQVLGADVELEITALDETNARIRPERIARAIHSDDGLGMVGIVGVQSNQFPRALDIARKLRAAGIQVCIGGFHVSGCLAMLPEMPADMRQAQELGISLFAGEAEGRLDVVLRDALVGQLKPLYNYMDDLPGLQGAPPPMLPAQRIERTGGRLTSFDAGRGCPFQCSFCTIINVQGRKSRYRSPDDIEAIIRSQPGAGHRSLLHHRRQPGAQQELGADLRPADRAARTGGPVLPLRHPGRHAVPQDPELHHQGGAGRRDAGLPRTGEHQPGQPDRSEEAAEPHLRVSQDAARVEAGRLLHLCRLHPRLPDRHARDHRARHHDHPARAAARSAGILLPHAAAGIGGSQAAVPVGRADGPRHEQVRSGACHHRASADVEGGVGAGLSARLADLLHAGAHGDGDASRRGDTASVRAR